MLELNRYYIHEELSLSDFFLVTYVIIDDLYHQVIPDEIRFRRNYNQAKLSDSEIITLALVGEMQGITSEKSWIAFVRKNYKYLFPNLCDRTRFNRTRRHLNDVIDAIRNELCKQLGYFDASIFIVDSMPIPVCEFGRAHFVKCFKDLASYGYCASKKKTYFGFKLHALVTLEGFITKIVLTPAHIDDREALWEISPQNARTIVLGDKGYIGDALAQNLEKQGQMKLMALKRGNSKNPYPKPIRNWISKHRRRIETTFSQLVEQLNIDEVLAKSKSGLIARINTKLLMHNLAYFINKCLGKNQDTGIGEIKHLIFG